MTKGDQARRRGRPEPWLRPLVWGLLSSLLLMPLVAMQLTEEVVWGVADFGAAVLLLAAAGGTFEAIARGPFRLRRVAPGLAMIGILCLLWVGGAVGLF